MSAILYYSTLCENSMTVVHELVKTKIQDDIHFVCLDKRVNVNGTIMVNHEGELLEIPHTINRVPALFFIKDSSLLFGNEIHEYVGNLSKNQQIEATNGNYEPYGFSSGTFTSIDNNELGNINYASATYDNIQKIETPPEDYVPDKINENNIKAYQDNRMQT